MKGKLSLQTKFKIVDGRHVGK